MLIDIPVPLAMKPDFLQQVFNKVSMNQLVPRWSINEARVSCLQRHWNTKSSEQLWWECLHPFVLLATNLGVTTELTQLPSLISPEVRKTASTAEHALKGWRNGKGKPRLASPDRQLPDASSRWIQMDSALGSLCSLGTPHCCYPWTQNPWENETTEKP